MDNAQLAGKSVIELLDLQRRGEVCALEIVEAHISRIEAVNPKLNAVVCRRYDLASSQARDVDQRRARGDALGPLAGIPVTIKDSIDVVGLPSTFGLSWRRDVLAESDDPHVEKLQRDGAIVLAKTNVAQLLMYFESDNPLYGRTVNPANPDRSCGGSSGGEGAIIAAAGSPLGLGTDIGGSVRIPAAFCGVMSLKPTAGRCPDRGRFSVPIGQTTIASQVGLLARQVDDLALGLTSINGASVGSVAPPLLDSSQLDPSKLTVGFYRDDPALRSSPAIRRAVEQAAKTLADAGMRVVEWQPPALDQATHLFFALLSADGGLGMTAILQREQRHPSVQAMLLFGARSRASLAVIRALLTLLGQPTLAQFTKHFGYHSADQYWQLVQAAIDYRDRFAAAMQVGAKRPSGGSDENIDLILGPVCALPAYRHGSSRDLGLGGGHTLLYNLLGYPAGVIPVTTVRASEQNGRPASRDTVLKAALRCDQDSANLPVAVQIAAPPWAEHRVLAAMRILERANAIDQP